MGSFKVKVSWNITEKADFFKETQTLTFAITVSFASQEEKLCFKIKYVCHIVIK